MSEILFSGVTEAVKRDSLREAGTCQDRDSSSLWAEWAENSKSLSLPSRETLAMTSALPFDLFSSICLSVALANWEICR